MPKRTRGSALERVSSYAGIAGLFLALLLGVATLSPEEFPLSWIAENAVAIGYVALALFGAAILGMCRAILDALRETALAERVRQKQAQRRVLAGQKRTRALHGEELAAWEDFYQEAQQAIYYGLGVREERLPLDLAWPWFRHYLREARAKAEGLPESFRQRALVRVDQISETIEREGPVIPPFPEASDIATACLGLRDWLLECRVRYFIDLYRRCGMEEPNLQDRLRLLTAEELESEPLPEPAS